MKKANIISYGQEYKGFILIENITDLLDYFHERFYGMKKVSAVNLVTRYQAKQRGEMVGHGTDLITDVVEGTCDIKGTGCAWELCKLTGTVEKYWIKDIADGRKIAINPINGISHFNPEDDAIINIITSNELYTESDIKISRWSGGTHWYAKIAFIDVVINGEAKWNSKIVAMNKAKEYLKAMYN